MPFPRPLSTRSSRPLAASAPATSPGLRCRRSVTRGGSDPSLRDGIRSSLAQSFTGVLACIREQTDAARTGIVEADADAVSDNPGSTAPLSPATPSRCQRVASTTSPASDFAPGTSFSDSGTSPSCLAVRRVEGDDLTALNGAVTAADNRTDNPCGSRQSAHSVAAPRGLVAKFSTRELSVTVLQHAPISHLVVSVTTGLPGFGRLDDSEEAGIVCDSSDDDAPYAMFTAPPPVE
jgi:hypothetical protein